ncbi:MAG: hypothetical protein BGO91_10245 [Leifsonia sp. 71-9]|nr:MAG: hypothetical protein BGO91_10245 [Leifsonia sp. 71-9]
MRSRCGGGLAGRVNPTIDRTARLLLRHPVTPVAVVLAVVGAAMSAPAAAEGDLGSAPLNIVALVSAVTAIALSERVVGTARTVVFGGIAVIAALLVGDALVAAGSRLGEAVAAGIEGEQLWAPSLVTAALLMALSARLRPRPRQAVRWGVLTTSAALLLFDGHAADVVRLLSALAGLAIGALSTRTSRDLHVRTSLLPRTRATVCALLFLMGAGALITLLLPEADGLLAPVGFVIGPVANLLVGLLTLVSAVLLLRGRLIGVVLAVAAQTTVVVLVVSEGVVAAIVSDTPEQSFSVADLEWYLGAVVACALPAGMAIALILLARRLVRRRATPADADARDRMRSLVVETGSGSLAFMGTWEGNSLWFAPDGAGAVAYRVGRGVAFTVSDPVAHPGRRLDVMLGFVEHCERMGWVPVFYSVHDVVVEETERLGWVRTAVGTESSIDLASFSLSGKRRQDLRTAVNRAGREGLRAEWRSFADLTARQRADVERLCTGWADHKALPEMGFTLGGFPELQDGAVRLMLAYDGDGRLHGVTSWLPVFRDGALTGWTLDVMRRADDAMPGVMEFLIASTAQRAAERGCTTVSLSGTPLAPHVGAAETFVNRLIPRLATWLEPAYGFASLRRFKAKFGATEQPLWMTYPTSGQLARIAPALAAVYVPDLSAKDLVRLAQLHPADAERSVSAPRR